MLIAAWLQNHMSDWCLDCQKLVQFSKQLQPRVRQDALQLPLLQLVV